MDTPLFYIFLFLHIVSLVVGFGSVIVIDTFGLLWLLKWFSVELPLVRKVANITQKLIWLGYSGMLVSGTVLIALKGFVDNLTKIKIFLVIMVGLNGIFLHIIKKSLDKLPEQSNAISKNIQFKIALASTISQFGWWGALLIGFLHRHISHNIPWPSYYGIICLVIAGTTIATYIVGQKLTKEK